MAVSKAELWTQLTYAIKIVDETFRRCGQYTPSFLSYLQTLEENYEGDHVNQTSSALAAIRSQLSTICANSAPLVAIIIELAQIGYNSKATTVNDALYDIYDGMLAASETVKNRAWTYGSVSVGASNVGTGVLYRLTLNQDNQTIEEGGYVAGTLYGEITRDKNTGAISGNESMFLKGQGIPARDNLYLGTSIAPTATLTARKATDGLLNNADFATYTDDDTDVEFDSWTATTTTKATHLTYDDANIYRPDGITAKFLTNNSLTQYITTFDRYAPVFLVVRYYRYASCDGTLTIRLGTSTVAVDLTTVADTTWHDLTLGITTDDGYYENFKENDGGDGVRISITLASSTTGALGLGEILLISPTSYDGKYYLLTAGRTDFLTKDNWSFVDSVSNTGRIQTTLARLFNICLPHTSGAPTYADA